MRKFILSLCFLSLAFSLYAMPVKGIRIESADGPMIVFVDGQQVCTPTMSCFVANINAGHYHIEVYSSRANAPRERPQKGKLLYNERLYYNGREVKDIYVKERRGEAPHGQAKNVMNDATFTRFLSTFKKEPFKSDRMALLENALITTDFTSAQCLQFTKLYSFDDDKMEIMKMIYPRIADKQDFFIVIDALTFSTNKDKMNDFIKAYHGKNQHR